MTELTTALVDEINAAHGACLGAAKDALSHAIEVGKLLVGAKAKMGHGGWLEWVHENCEFSEQTARAYMLVARRSSQLNRQCIGDLPFNQAVRLLSGKALSGDGPGVSPSVGLGATCTVADLQGLISAGKRFATIYADPPWKYGNQATRSSTDNHYATMAVDDIATQIPVEALAADNAHLHLWTTNAFLFDAKTIMEAWGFEYKSVFVWVKPQMGIGNYWRVSHEFLLFGLKGHLPFRDRGQMSWVEEPRTGHSQKPESVRERIEAVSPGPYLELFARRPVKGWTVWGDEIERDILTAGL